MGRVSRPVPPGAKAGLPPHSAAKDALRREWNQDAIESLEKTWHPDRGIDNIAQLHGNWTLQVQGGVSGWLGGDPSRLLLGLFSNGIAGMSLSSPPIVEISMSNTARTTSQLKWGMSTDEVSMDYQLTVPRRNVLRQVPRTMHSKALDVSGALWLPERTLRVSYYDGDLLVLRNARGVVEDVLWRAERPAEAPTPPSDGIVALSEAAQPRPKPVASEASAQPPEGEEPGAVRGRAQSTEDAAKKLQRVFGILSKQRKKTKELQDLVVKVSQEAAEKHEEVERLKAAMAEDRGAPQEFPVDPEAIRASVLKFEERLADLAKREEEHFAQQTEVAEQLGSVVTSSLHQHHRASQELQSWVQRQIEEAAEAAPADSADEVRRLRESVSQDTARIEAQLRELSKAATEARHEQQELVVRANTAEEKQELLRSWVTQQLDQRAPKGLADELRDDQEDLRAWVELQIDERIGETWTRGLKQELQAASQARLEELRAQVLEGTQGSGADGERQIAQVKEEIETWMEEQLAGRVPHELSDRLDKLDAAYQTVEQEPARREALRDEVDERLKNLKRISKRIPKHMAEIVHRLDGLAEDREDFKEQLKDLGWQVSGTANAQAAVQRETASRLEELSQRLRKLEADIANPEAMDETAARAEDEVAAPSLALPQPRATPPRASAQDSEQQQQQQKQQQQQQQQQQTAADTVQTVAAAAAREAASLATLAGRTVGQTLEAAASAAAKSDPQDTIPTKPRPKVVAPPAKPDKKDKKGGWLSRFFL